MQIPLEYSPPTSPLSFDYGILEKLLDECPEERPQYTLAPIPDLDSLLNSNPVCPTSR